ncbi:entericidin A/B family lipoprotein [Haloferula helveola]|uniref:entericidin A/B family lipoprotein n=1 Tax=Haloferula helveola TaxID=490095 RepID=UPI0030A6AF2B
MKSQSTHAGPSVYRILSFSALALLGYFALFCLTSCSTMAGVGQDVQKVGEEIEEAAY